MATLLQRRGRILQPFSYPARFAFQRALPFCAPKSTWGILFAALLCVAAPAWAVEQPAATSRPSLSLEQCVETALKNNRRRPVSRFAVAIAEAQHQQALSAYWPQVTVTGGYTHLDEPPNFIFPPSLTAVPAQTITTPASTALITVPAGVLGPTAVQLPVDVPAQTLTTAAQTFPVPAYEVKLMNKESVVGSASMQWLLFDGGMRSGLRQQGESYVAAMKQEARRTDIEIIDSVTRLYHGAVLARQLIRLAADTLAQMEATLRITETLYQGGGGTVTKSDYLENKVLVASVRGIIAALEKNESMAEAALANTMGLPWQAGVAPASTEIPFHPFSSDLETLVGTAYQFSPDWKQLEAALDAGEGAEKTARSGYAPKIALTGELHTWRNSYDAGMATRANKDGWSGGVAIQIPVFDGFLTRGKVAEARARLSQLKTQQLLLREGLALQIKDVFLGIDAAWKTYHATLEARTAAEENRQLCVRAYQDNLIATEKVVRAQLTEAFMAAQNLKVRYDHAILQSRLASLVGAEIGRQLSEN